MDRESFNHWLAAYGTAWTSRDPEAAASLYADNATYQVTPFDEPLRGRAAIYEYWAGVAKTEEKIQFDYEILAVTAEHGITRDRKSTRLNSSHLVISYAVFCLKKKNKTHQLSIY